MPDTVQTITFNPNASDLAVELQVLTPQHASYTIYLWDQAGANQIASWKGNNQSPSNDSYPLPSPLADNAHRLLQFDAPLIDAAGAGNQYQVDMIVYQEEKEIGRVSITGTMPATAYHATGMARLVSQTTEAV